MTLTDKRWEPREFVRGAPRRTALLILRSPTSAWRMPILQMTYGADAALELG